MTYRIFVSYERQLVYVLFQKTHKYNNPINGLTVKKVVTCRALRPQDVADVLTWGTPHLLLEEFFKNPGNYAVSLDDINLNMFQATLEDVYLYLNSEDNLKIEEIELTQAEVDRYLMLATLNLLDV